MSLLVFFFHVRCLYVDFECKRLKAVKLYLENTELEVTILVSGLAFNIFGTL